jgi:hypothetical protein
MNGNQEVDDNETETQMKKWMWVMSQYSICKPLYV